jgi:hypothetical protein
MAAVLATVSPIGSAVATPIDTVSAPRPRRFARRWLRDLESGKLVCAWESDPESRRPILHLRLVGI